MSDLISKQAAIEEIENTIKANSSIHYEMRYWEDGMNCAKNIIEELPSAQQNRLGRAVAGNSPEEIYDFLYWLMFDYARTFTDSRAAVIAWLKGESDG